MKIDPTCAVRNDCNATRSPVRLHHVTMPTERLLQVIERQLGDLVPQADRLRGVLVLFCVNVRPRSNNVPR
jgi:hypothetical protein